jgi:pyruvate dehydrogenase (quinone)
MGGVPKFAESQTLPGVDYAAFARSLGLGAINVDDGAALGDAWEQALSAGRPFVLDVRCDPDVAPIPPHATLEEIKALGAALAHGDENRWGVVKQGIRQKAQEFLPGGRRK